MTNRSKTTPKVPIFDIVDFPDYGAVGLYINGRFVTQFEDGDIEIEFLLILKHSGYLKATINHHFVDYIEDGEMFPVKFKDVKPYQSDMNIYMDGRDD